jgi:hypothetical protein
MMRKRKKLLRVVVAAALLVVAVPSAAAAYNLGGGGQSGARTEKAGCSLDPRLLRLEPELCRDNQVTAHQGTTTFDPARSDAVDRSNEAYSDRLAGIADLYRREADIKPAHSGDPWIGIDWLMVGIAVAAGGVAGLIVGLRRGRPQALS